MAGPKHTEQAGASSGPTVPTELAARLEAIGTGAYVVDAQGCIVAANARAAALLARPVERLIGQDAHDLLHRDLHGQPIARTQCAMRHAFLEGCPAQADRDYFARGDGVLLPIGWHITPYYVGQELTGTLVLFHASGRTVTSGPPVEEAGASLSELERLALLAETTTQLTSTLDVEEALDRLVRLVVPRLADWAVIDLITERDEVWRSAVVHGEGDRLTHLEELQGPMPPIPDESPMPLSRALRGVASTVAGPHTYQGEPDSGIAVEQRRLFEATGMHSAAIVPIRSTREVLGALTLGRTDKPLPFATADLPLLEDIARRAGLALDNARLYQRQRKVAETMQKHLLPQMPHVPHLRMTVRYLPAPHASQVGGDWYDAFPLSDGATALAVGDVVGHDLEAAAGMAQVRNMLRAYAWSQQDPPSRVVERLDRAVQYITEVTMATLLFARLERMEAGHWKLTWTNAGHPPPLMLSRDGVAEYLTGAHGILLGSSGAAPRVDATVTLPPGSTLVMYTDGLIEERGLSLDEGLQRLSRHAAALAHRPLDSFTDQLLRRVRPADNDDDVALLALRTPLHGEDDPMWTAQRRSGE
ncbi:GAF domain-containing SpoIIE family protein phosphatase [Streptomyces sp. NPDC049915]|uniref:GAF domain-containing SpoIIE family protein phosphatase n=1 Tax=Streptomyces sp. NPDC049915 TaxID=3155510 RepID=UPI00343E1AF2